MAARASAVSRVPTEIWWMIFDIVTCAPLAFSTLYNGDNWAVEALVNFVYQGYTKDYCHAEKDRKSIGAVCRAWRKFAEAKRYRYLDLQEFFHNSRVVLPPPNVIARARSITTQLAQGSGERNLAQIKSGVQWEVATVHHVHLRDLATIPHPQLRRLHTATTVRDHDNPLLIIKPLADYKLLTWLRLRLDVVPSLLPARRGHKHSLTLPNLEVLVFSVTTPTIINSFALILPKLRHYFLHTGTPPTVSFDDVLSPYRNTLESIAIKIFTAPLPPFKPEFFPQWADFPKLEELALDPTCLVEFRPLPMEHPLRRFYAPKWSLQSLNQWLESVHLQKIRLLGGKWTEEGALVSSAGRSISKTDMDDIFAKAKAKNILVEVGSTWNDSPLLRIS
ncbi:hypothetical protein FS842_001415 [Serendipita sp. 407]|nr:hypothetical protein FS842_001415 [Serendipita sp. 407]